MKFKLLLAFICLVPSYLRGQAVQQFSMSSEYELVYRLTTQEASMVAHSGSLVVADFDLFNRIPTDTIFSDRPGEYRKEEGFYLRVKTYRQRLQATLELIQSFEIEIIPDGKLLRFVLLNPEGDEVRPEEVRINHKSVSYHRDINAYQTRTKRGENTIVVRDGKREAIFPIFRPYKRFFDNFGNKVLYSFPVRLVYKPGREIYQSIAYGEPVGIVRRVGSVIFRDLRREQVYGYILLNKPKYHPGDTLLYKLKLSKTNGRPYNKKVALEISGYTGKNYHRTLKLKGGQTHGEIVLHDSLDLRLDGYQRLEVTRFGNSLMSRSFDYEDYVLKSEDYKLSLHKPAHSLNDKNEVILSGWDENDKRLKNSRYELLVRVLHIEKNNDNRVLQVPNILLEKRGPLLPAADTKIILADSLFPSASLQYEVQVSFINAANDRIEKSANGYYRYDEPEVTLDLEQDTLLFNFPEAYKDIQSIRLVSKTGFGISSIHFEAQNPVKVKANPSHTGYRVYASDSTLLAKFRMDSYQPGVNHTYQRTPDSLKVSLSNERKIPLWYSLYREKRLIEEGFTEQAVSIDLKAKNKDKYLMHYRYLWAGTVRSRQVEMDLFDRLLTIDIDQQQLIIPGVKDSIRLRVTNYKGKPVPNVDVAAMSITSKFKSDNIPSVPYFAYGGNLKIDHNRFDLPHSNHSNLRLNHAKWEAPFRLDTMRYYKVTRPENLTINYMNTADEQTQFAVLSLRSGTPESISYIKLDGELVFTHFYDLDVPFSFRATAGYHKVELRTSANLIKVDSVYFEEGKKTIISIEKGGEDKRISRSKPSENYKLSKQETSDLARHTLQVQLPSRKPFSVIQGSRVFEISRNYRQYNQLGPFTEDSLTVITADANYEILFEPGFVYEFINDQVFKKADDNANFNFGTIDDHRLFDLLPSDKVAPSNEDYKSNAFIDNARIHLSTYAVGTGQGIMSLNPPLQKQELLTGAYFQHRKDVVLSPFGPQLTTVLDSGMYTVVLLYADSTFISENIKVASNSTTLFSPDIDSSKPLSEWPYLIPEEQEAEKSTYKPLAIKIPPPNANLTGFVSGIVTGADDGLPLPQVTVMIKGTTTGTPTDFNGFYKLPIANNRTTLVFRYLGYVTQEINTAGQGNINVQLNPDAQSLGEVVVTGQAIATSSLRRIDSRVVMGRIPGLQIENDSGGVPGAVITLRGLSTIGDDKPLYVVDGVVVSNMDNTPQELIDDISVLKGASATAIYGARGSNGVVIVSTKNGRPGQQMANNTFSPDQETSEYSIRNNFRDYGYWVPSVTTDKNGEATLVVEYPDDITAWQNHFLAMSNRGFTGQLTTTVNAFKPLRAKLSIPSFLISGDAARIYGEISSYTGDTISVSRNFRLSDQIYDLGIQAITQGQIDSLDIKASEQDSLAIAYLFEAKTGVDGEQRILPVFKRGMEQTEGQLYILEKDTSITILPEPGFGSPQITIVSNLRGLMLEDIHRLQEYAYWCNEQTASKLIALLAEKELLSSTKTVFRKNRQVNSLLRRIRKAQNEDGGWGWWQNMRSAMWVTNHVTRALLQARLNGYDTKADLTKSSQVLIRALPYLRGGDLIETMHVLLDIDPQTDLANYLKVAQAQVNLSVTNKIRLMHLDYRINKVFSADSLAEYRKESMIAGTQYQDSTAGFHANDVAATLSAYQLLRDIGQQDEALSNIRKYLLLNRQTASISNTFQAANIINIIGRDLDTTALVPTISVNDLRINSLPYHKTMTDSSPVDLKIESGGTTYLTVSQSQWNKTPEISNKLGQIQTSFLSMDGVVLDSLQKGERATLSVAFSIDESHNFVMLEVPIPAGCNYFEKPQPYQSEQYREYFKDRANFYFESLEPGTYEFEIPLISQFPGSYTINPARLSLMYSPLLSANNEVKKIIIR